MHFYMHPYLHNFFILVKSGCYTAIVARVTGRRKLLRRSDCHLLLLLCWWSAVVLLLLLWAIAPELWRRAAWLSRGWGVDHTVLRGSTARTASGGSRHCPLPFLLFNRFTGLNGALLVNSSSC
jgi:hypothetical protein